jgi:hypothetical protein
MSEGYRAPGAAGDPTILAAAASRAVLAPMPGSPIVECPSGFAFKARKLTGRIMAQIAAKAEVDDLSTIVSSCCVEVLDAGPYALGDKDGLPNWKRVISGDLSVAFIRLRAMSIPPSHDGEIFKWRVKCANTDCLDEKGKRTEFFWQVRLCELPIVKLTEHARALVKRGNDAFPGKLLDGRAFTFKLPSDEDGAVVRKLLRDSGIPLRGIAAEEAANVLAPFTVASVVTSIEGVPRDQVHTTVLDLDPWSQVDIREQVSKVDAGFDSFKGKCAACGLEFDLALPFSPQLLLSLSSTELKAAPKMEPPASSEGLGASSTTASPG